MTSVGRGRGRGWAQSNNDSLRKPGRPSPSEDINSANIINMINLIDNENYAQRIQEIVQCIDNKMQWQSLRDICMSFYKEAINNPQFRENFILALESDAIKDIRDSDGNTLAKHLLNLFEINYKRRVELRQMDMVQFRMDVYFFHKVLCNTNVIRIYPKCKDIVQAVVDYIEMLLETAAPEDIKVFVEIVILHEKRFPGMFKNNEDSIMIRAREILIKENLSPLSRQLLLYAIDVINYQYKSLPKNLQKFYESQLGADFV